MIERKFQALAWQRKKSFLTDDRKEKPYPPHQVKRQIKYNADMKINIPDLEVAYLSSHEGFTKLRHFWFQYHVCHCMNYYTFIYDLAYCTKLSRQFWSSKRQRARVSDFSQLVQWQFIHKIPARYIEGFCTQRCMEYIDLNNFEYLPWIFL